MEEYVSECVLDTRFNSEMAMHIASVLFLKYVGKRALIRAKMQIDGFSPSMLRSQIPCRMCELYIDTVGGMHPVCIYYPIRLGVRNSAPWVPAT